MTSSVNTTRRGLVFGAALAACWRAQAAAPVAARIQRVQIFDAALAGQRLIAVGERGSVFVSDDAGAQWRQGASGVESDLTALTVPAPSKAWAVGHHGTIVRTSDAGVTWQPAQVDLPEANALFDVAADGLNGWAVGAFGVLAQTSDGGATWLGRRAMGDEFDKHLYGIARTAAGPLFIVGENGTLLTSRDQGANWSALASPYIGSFFGIAVLDDDRLLIHGMRGHVYRSDDAGRSWTRVKVPEGLSIQGARRVGPRTVTLVGLEGAVFVSADNGTTFTMLPPADRRSARIALAAPDGRLLVFGEAGFYPLPASPR